MNTENREHHDPGREPRTGNGHPGPTYEGPGYVQTGGSVSPRGRSSVEIKEDINRTRSHMDETIDRLGERLRPRNLIDEAVDWAAHRLGKSGGHSSSSSSSSGPSRTDWAKEQMGDAASYAKHRGAEMGEAIGEQASDIADQIRDSASDVGRQVGNFVRDHPIPTALVGAGLTWMIISQAQKSGGSGTQPRTDIDRDLRRRPPHGQYGAVPPAPHRQTPDDDPYTTPADFTNEELRRGAHTGMSTAGPIPVGPTDEELHESHPDEGTTVADVEAAGNEGRGSTEEWRDRARHAAGRVGDTAGHSREQAGELGREARDRASDLFNRARGRAGGMLSSNADRMNVAADRMRHWASDTQHRTASSAQRAASGSRDAMLGMQDHAGSAYESARSGLGYASHRMQEGASMVGQYSQDTLTAARDRTADTYEEHPLSMGFGAFAAGLLTGLLIPPTRKENEWMGSTSDDLRHWAMDAGYDAVEHAQEVAGDAANAAIDTIEDENLNPSDLSERVQHVAASAAEAARDTAREQGIAPEQLKEKAADVAEAAKEEASEKTQEHADDLKESASRES